MVLPPLEVLKITIQLLDSYKGDASLDDLIKPQKGRCAPEDFLEEQFRKKSYSPIIQEKVCEIFFTISKYRRFFEEVLNDYQSSKSQQQTKLILSNDTSLLLVILYLVTTSLTHSTSDKISEILINLNDKKSLAFFNYLKKPSMINHLFKWGCEIWELDYVKQFLANILDDDQLFQAVFNKLNSHLYEKKKNKSVKKLTVPVELNVLKHPRREIKKQPEEFANKTTRRHLSPFFENTSPLVFPSPPKPAEVPRTTYLKPVDETKLEEARLKNHQDAIQLYEEAQEKAFSCAGVEKSEKYKETIEKIEKERYAVPKRKKLKPKLPNNETIPPPKKTAAVILREGARLMKVEKEEIKRYEELASGAFNDDAFIIWEREMREEKIRQDLEEIERKHLQGLISYEDALLAKQKYLRKTKEKADEFRKEKEIWQGQLETWKKEEQERIKECVAKEKESEKGVREAVELAKEEKHKKAIEAMQESRALREQWLRQKEEELQKKIQLIQEIKALQALGVIKKKNADLSETSNMGLLCEMSIAELRERLILLKMELKEEVEKRKDEIMKRRECRKEIVESYQGLIESHHEIMKLKKETPRSSEKLIKKPSPSVENLRRKLEEKRNERLKQK